MRTIRTNVFETNSSSIHVLSICKESVYNDFFDKGIGLWCEYKEEILSYEEVAKILKEYYYKDENYQRYFKENCSENYTPDPEKIFSVENIENVVDTYKDGVHSAYETIDLENGIEDDKVALLYWLSEDFYTAKEWAQQDWVEEAFDQTYTTDSGEKIVAFGYYGR